MTHIVSRILSAVPNINANRVSFTSYVEMSNRLTSAGVKNYDIRCHSHAVGELYDRTTSTRVNNNISNIFNISPLCVALSLLFAIICSHSNPVIFIQSSTCQKFVRYSENLKQHPNHSCRPLVRCYSFAFQEGGQDYWTTALDHFANYSTYFNTIHSH